MRAGRLPTVLANGSASLVITEKPPMKAWRPMRQNWCTAEKALMVAQLCTVTWPPSVAALPKIVSSPTWQSCATWA